MKESELRLREELEEIAKRSGGTIQAEAVVEFAKNPKTALHSKFEWENSRAAHAYRVWQARQLISVIVRFEPSIEENVRVYVSLPNDRGAEDGGYRRMIDVLNDSGRRGQLLDYALAELDVFQKKYALLKELAGVFSAATKVRARRRTTVKRKTVLAR